MRGLYFGRSLLVLTAAFSLGPVVAQQATSFAGLDADGDGRLSRAEFARLQLVELPELFADLDNNRDHYVSVEEWIAGSPDQTGIPRGSRPAIGTGPPRYPSFVQHGRNVPQVVPKKADRGLPEQAPLTGHGGTPGRNRSVPPRLPPPPPQMPPGGLPPPF